MYNIVQSCQCLYEIKNFYCHISPYRIRGLSHAQEEIRFNHLNAENGGINNAVSCILQDNGGYIWIGTSAGLLKYDGNNIVTYVHNEGDSTSICNSRIDCIYEDNMHNIWIGTFFGLSRFNPLKKNFTNYYFDKWSASMESNVVAHIMQDNKGLLWVSTNTGVYKTDPKNANFSLVKSFTEDHYGYLIHQLGESHRRKYLCLWIQPSYIPMILEVHLKPLLITA